MKKIKNKVLLLLTFVVLYSISNFSFGQASVINKRDECTVLIAGKSTTIDGSILFAKSEDDSPSDIDYLWYVPRKKFDPGSVVRLEHGGTISQVRETFAYFWDECPGTSYSNGIINEWGVAFGSNGCTSKEDPVAEVEARGDLSHGGLGFEFRMILAERSKSAREAVLLAAELIDEYGYNGSGRNLNIVGPDEAWQLQIVRGKRYVARRVQDNEVVIIGNTFSIREIDMNDKENFICSPDLIDYAIERGWYDPYAPQSSHCNPVNTHRQWFMAQSLNKNFPITWIEAQKGAMPVSVQPDHKLSLNDIMEIFRSHYEGTELDKSNNYDTSPHKSPFFTICNYGTHRTTIIQQRRWLPVELGTVIWRALERPCSNVFIPWYLGITKIPNSFQHAPEYLNTTPRELLDFHFNMSDEAWSFNLESSAMIFKLLAKLVDVDYKRNIKMVQEIWKDFEEIEFNMQPVIEKCALKLYKKDRALAKELLTFYSNSQAYLSLEEAKSLIVTLKKDIKSPEACIELGMFYFEFRDNKFACEYFEKAIGLDPGNADAKKYLKWIQDLTDIENNPVLLTTETLKEFVGDYGPRHITMQDNSLFYNRDGGIKYKLEPISTNTFALKGKSDFRLHFAQDNNGQVNKIIGLYFDGRKDESVKDL